MRLVGDASLTIMDGHDPVDAEPPVIAGRITPAFRHSTDRPTHQHWHRYTAWRRTKCRPRDFRYLPDKLADLNQATLEFVGEAAEFAAVVVEAAAGLATDPAARARLIDEAGDVFFCGAWVLDAWESPVLTSPDFPAPSLVLDEADRIHMQRGRLLARALGDDEDSAAYLSVQATVLLLAAIVASEAGALCNSLKKMFYQDRPQHPEEQVARVRIVFGMVAMTLAFADATVEDALLGNVEKLDLRYPNGYQPDGPGGGIRTGKGA